MTNSADLELVRKFALEKPENLDSFLRICSCSEEVKAHLRNEFIGILKKFLRKHLENGDWALEDRMRGKWNESYPNLSIYKTKFGLTNYHVAMQSERRVARMIGYGIVNGDGKKPSQSTNSEIWEIMNENVPQGARPSTWWSWWKYFEPPYIDWNNHGVLMQMFQSTRPSNDRPEITLDPMVEMIGNKLIDAASTLDLWFKRQID